MGPPTAAHQHATSNRFSQSDFIFRRTPGSNLDGTLSALSGIDANRNLLGYTVTCWLGNEDKAAWVALKNATTVAVPDYDSLEQLDAHDGCKVASSAHHTAFWFWQRRPETRSIEPT